MIAFYTGSNTINYPTLLTLAVLAGCIWIILTESRDEAQGEGEAAPGRAPDPFLAGVSALTVGLLAARLGFVVLHLGYYRLNLSEVFFLWEGGLSGIGAGAGALLGLGLYALYSGGEFWTLGDALAAPAQFVLFGAWIGCWYEGCAYGIPLEAGLPIQGADPFGSTTVRWPTQGVGVLLSVFAFALLAWIGERETPSGLRFATSLTAGAFSSAAISLYRSDPAMLLGPARLDTCGYAVLTLIGLIMMGNRLYAPRGA